MENKIYKLGIVGFGGMAGNHYKELTNHPATRVTPYGVYDINSERMADAQSKGMKTYESLEGLLNDADIDIVLVSTPNDVHKEIAIKALEAGKHVIVEKPATLSSADLQDIIDTAARCNRVFTVDQNRRTNRDYILMRRNVESGILGETYIIESRVEGSRGMPKGWRTSKQQGGGMMLDWGVHLIDQLLYMYPEKKVKWVHCNMFSVNYPEVDDNFRLDFQLENGPLAHIEVSTNNFILHPRWYVLGKDGTLQIDSWDCSGQVVRCKEREDTWSQEIAKIKAGPTKTMAPRSKESVDVIPLSEPEGITDSLSVVYKGFLSGIEGGELYVKPQEEVMRVMKVMEAAFESAKTCSVIHTDI